MFSQLNTRKGIADAFCHSSIHKAGDVAQLVQCLQGVQEALCSTPEVHEPGMVVCVPVPLTLRRGG